MIMITNPKKFVNIKNKIWTSLKKTLLQKFNHTFLSLVLKKLFGNYK